MTSQHRLKVKEVFFKTLELPLAARPAFLSKACGDDKDLFDEVQSLLKAHEGAGDFLQSIDTQVKSAALDAAQTNIQAAAPKITIARMCPAIYNTAAFVRAL